MSFKNFLKDKLWQIFLICFVVVTIEIFLLVYPLDTFVKVYIAVAILMAYLIGILIEYFIKNNYYKKALKLLDELEEKYLVTEIIENPNFSEGKIFKNILEQAEKSMHENVNKYKYLQEDYKEYVELWIHEIKTPIATSKMIIENNKNVVTKSIDEEIDEIENYIEQALYYARSNTTEKDYCISKSKLEDIVNECIRKNKSLLLNKNIVINIHNLDLEVDTDSKWIVFILNQIVQNSIKYMKEKNSEIEIYAKKGKENVILYVKDNGIGIKESEIGRVFEKGFTGTNGRTINKKSTGIGLYLSKKLCNKLGIGIEIDSKINEGTEVKLIFPKGSYNLD